MGGAWVGCGMLRLAALSYDRFFSYRITRSQMKIRESTLSSNPLEFEICMTITERTVSHPTSHPWIDHAHSGCLTEQIMHVTCYPHEPPNVPSRATLYGGANVPSE
jgi:hypothetical protein